MKVIIAGNRIVRMSKRTSRQEFSATYIGITVVDAAAHECLFYRINDLIRRGDDRLFMPPFSGWWTKAFTLPTLKRATVPGRKSTILVILPLPGIMFFLNWFACLPRPGISTYGHSGRKLRRASMGPSVPVHD